MRVNDFVASLRKTTVVNVDEGSHPLPPDLGPFAEYRVGDYICPPEWNKDGVFIPVKEGDPMWFDFRGNEECAVMVTVQKVNPVTGEKVDLKLSKEPQQNYLWLPKQIWLDGYSNNGKVYQFMVTKSGIMQAVNEHVLDRKDQDSWAIGFAFFPLRNPKPKEKVVFRDIHHYHNVHACHAWPCTICHPVYHFWHYGSGHGGSGSHYTLGSPSLIGGHRIKSSGFLRSAQNLYDEDILSPAASVGAADTITEADAEVNFFSETDILAAEREVRTSAVHFDKASIGAGGRIQQAIVPDPNTVEYYVEKPTLIMNYYLCLPEQFEAIMTRGRRQSDTRDESTGQGAIGKTKIPLIRLK